MASTSETTVRRLRFVNREYSSRNAIGEVTTNFLGGLVNADIITFPLRILIKR
jgi:hypothetical protein